MSFNSFQNTLEQLENAKNLQAETDFNETIQDINDKANEQTGLFGDIEKAGASVGGVVVAGKSIKSLYDKIQALRKGKAKAEPEEEDNIEGSSEPSDFQKALDDDNFDEMRRILGKQSEAEAAPEAAPEAVEGEGEFTLEGNPFNIGLKDVTDAIQDKVQQTVRQVTGQDEPTVTETPLEPKTLEEPDTGLPIESSEPAGIGGGDIELAPVKGAVQQPSEETDLEGFTGEGEAVEEEASTSLGDVLSNLTSKVASGVSNATSAVKSATSGLADAAAAGAEEGAEELGAAGTEELAGAAADFIPVIGPIIGTILQGIGIATSVGGIAAGIIGTADAGADQAKATTAAERTEQAAKDLPPANLAGEYAVGTSSLLQQIN